MSYLFLSCTEEDLLSAQEVAIISDLYSAPEVYLKADRKDLVFLA